MYYVLCAATIVKYGGKGLNIYIYLDIMIPENEFYKNDLTMF